MGSLLIRKLDDRLKRKLRLRAARHSRSMEEEARDILRSALTQEPRPTRNLWKAIRARIEPLGGVELPEVPDQPVRKPPNFR